MERYRVASCHLNHLSDSSVAREVQQFVLKDEIVRRKPLLILAFVFCLSAPINTMAYLEDLPAMSQALSEELLELD